MSIINTILILIIFVNLIGIYMNVRGIMRDRNLIKQIRETREKLIKINDEIEMRLLQDDDRRGEYQAARDTILRRHNIG